MRSAGCGMTLSVTYGATVSLRLGHTKPSHLGKVEALTLSTQFTTETPLRYPKGKVAVRGPFLAPHWRGYAPPPCARYSYCTHAIDLYLS